MPQLLVSGGPRGTEIELITYSRYPLRYDFQSEQEARLVRSDDDREVVFEEIDVLSVIVPTRAAKRRVERTIKKNWTHRPSVVIYPARHGRCIANRIIGILVWFPAAVMRCIRRMSRAIRMYIEKGKQ